MSAGSTRLASDEASIRSRLDAALADVRARIRGHLGDVVVSGFAEGKVTLDFLGACRGCPAQAFTFVAVVEPALLAVEGVMSVEPPRSACSPAVRERILRVIAGSQDQRG